jgi:erythromycin esterase-like protein
LLEIVGMAAESILAQAIAEQAVPLVGSPTDFDLLLDRIGDARFVLIGEATHGSHDFYRIRAELTKRLIREKGFAAVAAEADWPDAYRVNRYVRGIGDDVDAVDALADFRRFPQWMWRNADVLDFVGWLRSHNDQLAEPAFRVGFYGLDLYSLHASMAAVLSYLDAHDPEAARRARARYACFDEFGDEPQHYGHAVAAGIAADCERAVLATLLDLLKRRGELVRKDGLAAEDAQFEAEQNARVVARAEEYYRMMYLGGASTWNLRDTHMADTLDALAAHLERRGRSPKIVVWAHNSHVGDAAAMSHRADRDEITIGGLCRRRHARDAILVGFTTFAGTVTAASSWGGDAERKAVRPALPGSYEALFHETGVPRFLLLLDDLGGAASALNEAWLERAIGVVYRPQTERASHYFHVRLARQLDAVIHIDQTRALEPLERTTRWDRGELVETYPSGL